MTYLFVDTNILLHFRRLEEIDWLRLAKAQTAAVMLAPVVIRELDQHKDSHPQQKLRKRAQEVTAHLYEKLRSGKAAELRDHVTLQYVAHEPTINFAAHQLQPQVNDDCLIASVLESSLARAGDEFHLVSSDLGIILKAQAHGISAIHPDEQD